MGKSFSEADADEAPEGRPLADDRGSTSRALGRHLALTRDGLTFVDPARAGTQPALWLEAFLIARRGGFPVSAQIASVVQQHVANFTADDFTVTEGQRAQILGLLTPGPGLHAALTAIERTGLLRALLPELAEVTRVVGESDVPASIRALESLYERKGAGRRLRFSGLVEDLRAPELLTLSLLFNPGGDDGPGPPEGAGVVTRVAERLQLPLESEHTLQFLVTHRDLVPRTAVERDISDPQVVARLATLAANEENLKMLCLRAFAEQQAANPGSPRRWKHALLWRLFLDARNSLALGKTDHDEGMGAAALAVVQTGRPQDISEAELSRFLNSVSKPYLAAFGLATIYAHVRMARDISPDEVDVSLEQHRDIWQVTVVGLRRAQQFSMIAGVLTAFGMAIHRARAMTTQEGLRLDVFEFSDERGFLSSALNAGADLIRVLRDTLKGVIDGPPPPDLKASGALRTPLVVKVDADHVAPYTRVQISAPDAPGLLHCISSVIAAHGCDVALALIATEGDTAVDVLHVTKAAGMLGSKDRAALRQSLLNALTPSPAVPPAGRHNA